MIDINKIQSALRSLKEERVHIEEASPENPLARKTGLNNEVKYFQFPIIVILK